MANDQAGLSGASSAIRRKQRADRLAEQRLLADAMDIGLGE